MSARNTAIKHWGEPLPDWVEAFAAASDATSQRAAAKKIGYSGAVSTLVFTKKYNGGMDKIEERVRVMLMDKPMICPRLGEIMVSHCESLQSQPRSDNVLKLMQFKACQKCPFNKTNKKEEK